MAKMGKEIKYRYFYSSPIKKGFVVRIHKIFQLDLFYIKCPPPF